jgi:hypothetical protein
MNKRRDAIIALCSQLKTERSRGRSIHLDFKKNLLLELNDLRSPLLQLDQEKGGLIGPSTHPKRDRGCKYAVKRKLTSSDVALNEKYRVALFGYQMQQTSFHWRRVSSVTKEIEGEDCKD